MITLTGARENVGLFEIMWVSFNNTGPFRIVRGASMLTLTGATECRPL